jgi:hypothetical protein
MKLFHWWSDYLERYSSGHIIAMGETVEDARAIARSGLDAHYFRRYEYLYSSLEEMLKDADELAEYREAQAKLEADLAQDPEVLPGYIWIEGSE